jgi:hypothetical protein
MKPHLLFIFGLLTICNSDAQPPTKAQEPRITHQWINVPFSTIKNYIEDSTNCTFWGEIDNNFPITINVINEPVSKVVEAILIPHGYSVTFVDNLFSVDKLSTNLFTLKGKVITKREEPVDATITVKGTLIATMTDTTGRFTLKYPERNFTVIITAINCKAKEKQINGNAFVKIIMEDSVSDLQEVLISFPKKTKVSPVTQQSKDSLSLGVNDIKTGSMLTYRSDLLNWVPATNLTGKLSIAAGVLGFNANTSDNVNQSPITIRNRITIYGNPHILVILNGFPYQGDINQINPNDVESITIVKDAAASTQQGLYAGNGVMLVNTKTGSYNHKPTITALANTTLGMTPDLYYLPHLNSKDHIEITRSLFENGYYDDLLRNASWSVIPPAVAIMQWSKLGVMSKTDAEAALNDLRNTDIRSQARKYLYQKSIRQQYHISSQGGGNSYHYYYSLGYDFNKLNLIGNSDTRLTNNLNNTFKLGTKGPEFTSNIYFSQSIKRNNGISMSNILFPYETLVDKHGNHAAVTRSLSQSYKDSINSTGTLLNWDYKPLDEIKSSNNKVTNSALHVKLDIKYNILKNLKADASYMNETEILEYQNLHSLQTYPTRDLINRYTQIDSSGISHPIPLGAITDKNTITRNVNNIKAQLKYTPVNNESNSLVFNAGTEIRHLTNRTDQRRFYGVTRNEPAPVIDYNTYYSMLYEPGITNRIPKINDHIDTIEHFYGVFANGVYTWKNKLNASISYRKDESNIFGVQANLKGVPLISAGLSWDISDENFYHARRSSLRLRLSSGYCSNASQSYSSLTGLQNVGTNSWNAPINMITTPPNPLLSWETVHITNAGADFSLFNNKVWGTAEYFTKQSNNLLGLAPINPTSGIPVFQGNVAAMTGHGFEAVLNTKIGNKKFQWQSALQMSYVRDKVTRYFIKQPAIWYYCDSRFLNPIPGKPLYTIYSLAFRGLDSLGDPVGYHNNNLTKDYNAILQSPDLTELVYHGSATPTFYGSFRNTFTWKRLELGFNILWKAGYYFRSTSVNYNAILNGTSIGHADFTKRWQKPGDELLTNIPSLRYPLDYSRDQFFNYSSALIERGDHIRLQDIRLTYHPNKKHRSKFVRSITELYGYANNLGLLWRANNIGIDPDFLNTIPMPLTITIGFKAEF